MRPSKPDSASGELDAEACTRAALDLLARREHSRRELTRKLGARGFSNDMIASALDGLERSGALAEARFTESFVRTRVAKGQGPARIRAELKQRGVADADADGALREAEVDWLATIRAVRLKRFGPEPPRDYRERARQARFLEYRGFDGEQIRTALDGDVEE